MHLPSATLWNRSQIRAPRKFKKNTSIEGSPWFYQLKSWRPLTQHLFYTHCGVFTSPEILGPSSTHLQWLSNKVWQRSKTPPFPCRAQSLRALNPKYKPKKPIFTQPCNMDPGTPPHPAWDGRDLIRPKKMLQLTQEQGMSIHRNERDPNSWRHLKSTLLQPLSG